MATDCTGQACYYCKVAEATHFCAGCGNCVCSSPVCLGLATVTAIRKQTVRVVQPVTRKIAGMNPLKPF